MYFYVFKDNQYLYHLFVNRDDDETKSSEIKELKEKEGNDVMIIMSKNLYSNPKHVLRDVSQLQ
jgi:hypothetical protein